MRAGLDLSLKIGQLSCDRHVTTQFNINHAAGVNYFSHLNSSLAYGREGSICFQKVAKKLYKNYRIILYDKLLFLSIMKMNSRSSLSPRMISSASTSSLLCFHVRETDYRRHHCCCQIIVPSLVSHPNGDCL